MGEELLRDAPARSPPCSQVFTHPGGMREEKAGQLRASEAFPLRAHSEQRSNGSLMSFSVLSTELTDPSPKSS